MGEKHGLRLKRAYGHPYPIPVPFRFNSEAVLSWGMNGFNGMTANVFPNLPNIVIRSSNLMAVGCRKSVLKVLDLGPARKKIAEIILQTAITSLGFIHGEGSECSQVAVVIDGLDGISEALTFCTDSKILLPAILFHPIQKTFLQHVNVCDKSNLLKKIKAHNDDLKVAALRSDGNLKSTSIVD
jgi:hypothetical protein